MYFIERIVSLLFINLYFHSIFLLSNNCHYSSSLTVFYCGWVCNVYYIGESPQGAFVDLRACDNCVSLQHDYYYNYHYYYCYLLLLGHWTTVEDDVSGQKEVLRENTKEKKQLRELQLWKGAFILCSADAADLKRQPDSQTEPEPERER